MNNFLIGTSIKNGGYYTIAQKFKKNFLKEYSVDLLTQSTSLINFDLLKKGKIDMALVQGDIIDKFFNKEKLKNIEYFFTPYYEHFTFVARYDSEYENFWDLNNAVISVNHENSGVYNVAGDYLKESAINKKFDIKIYNTKKSIEKLLSREIDGFFIVQVHPSNIFTKLVLQKKIKFIHLRAENNFSNFTFFEPGEINLNLYDNSMNEKIRTWGMRVAFLYSNKIPKKLEKEIINFCNDQ